MKIIKRMALLVAVFAALSVMSCSLDNETDYWEILSEEDKEFYKEDEFLSFLYSLNDDDSFTTKGSKGLYDWDFSNDSVRRGKRKSSSANHEGWGYDDNWGYRPSKSGNAKAKSKWGYYDDDDDWDYDYDDYDYDDYDYDDWDWDDDDSWYDYYDWDYDDDDWDWDWDDDEDWDWDWGYDDEDWDWNDEWGYDDEDWDWDDEDDDYYYSQPSSGGSSPSNRPSTGGGTTQQNTAPSTPQPSGSASSDAGNRIVSVAQKYISYKPTIPYRLGGRSASGMDCSGYVHTVVKEALNIDLPTSAQGIYNSSRVSSISTSSLVPGDLMFFSHSGSRSNITHIAIYVGTISRNGKMTRYFYNSASSPNGKGETGVITSFEQEPYWTRTFIACGRVK